MNGGHSTAPGRTLRSVRSVTFSGLLIFAGAACPAATPREWLVDGFAYASDGAARKAWSAPESPTPPVRRAEGGLRFACPFGTAAVDRFYWDRTVQLDLSRCDSIEIDLDIDRPESMRALNLYLESGNGWYVWSRAIPKPGRQVLRLARSDFAAEGRPAGWRTISRIRLSPWRGMAVDARLTVFRMSARANAVVLIRGTASHRNATERRMARDVTDRLRGWLADGGVPHGVLNDEEVTEASLSAASVAVLGYNHELPPREFDALKAFVRRGGRLMVWYSSDPRLADLLGFKLGEYRRAQTPSDFASVEFVDPAAWRTPARVGQQSGNIRPALPASPDAKVIAWWADDRGRRTGQPAWTASPAGLWMSHIPLRDDAANKRHMLVALLARLCPEVWPAAARAELERAGRIDSFRGFDDAVASIRAAAEKTEGGDRALALLDRAAVRRATMSADYTGGRHADVVANARLLRAELTEAYARVQPAAPHEMRGVWDHDGTGWYPGDWDRTCRELAASGINTVFPNLLWGGAAHYPSKVLPVSFTARQYGDQLDLCVRAAHARGLKVHAWMVCWNLSTAPADFAARMKREGRLQAGGDGAAVPWLNPAHPENIALQIDALREVVRRAPVDGLHLDYARYPSSQSDLSPFTREAFERDTGRTVGRWPADVSTGGRRAAEYRRWRVAQITGFVRKVRSMLETERPGAQLSAAVFAEYPDCADTVGQDWGRWVQEGLVDFVCPMTYTENLSAFAARSAQHLRLPGAAGRVCPGIGVCANESTLAADQVIEQILTARRAGARGFVLFDLNPTLRDDVLPMLRLGVTGRE